MANILDDLEDVLADVTISQNLSVKKALGIDKLCLGVCSVCEGKGFNVIETYEEIIKG